MAEPVLAMEQAPLPQVPSIDFTLMYPSIIGNNGDPTQEKEVEADVTPDLLAMHLQQKKGSNCCCCCCDFRRAVVIANIFNLFILLLLLICYLGGGATAWNFPVEDDDAALKPADAAYKKEAIMVIIGFLFAFVALVGAARFNAILVGANMLWMIIQFATNTSLSVEAFNSVKENYKSQYSITQPIYQYFLGGIVLVLFLYSHGGFVYEVCSGVMSKETYPREESSCCCAKRSACCYYGESSGCFCFPRRIYQ